MRPLLIFLPIVLLNLVIAGRVLLHRRRIDAAPAGPIRIGVRDAARAVVTVSMAGVCELLVAGRDIFGAIHILYLHAVVLLPALGILVLIAGWFRRGGERRFATSGPVRLLAAVSLLAIPIGIWATFIEPFRLQLEQAAVTVPPARSRGRAIRVAVLADLQTAHVGEHERRAVELAMSQQPDIILLPGDLWQGDPDIAPEELAALKELLNRLSAPGGVYFCPGNCDAGRAIENYLEGTPVRLLNNTLVRTYVGEQAVTIGGVELNLTPQAAATVCRLESGEDASDIRILLAHYPDHIRSLEPQSRIDLVVAGHTHGGQIAIPGWGPPLTLSHVPRQVAAGGLGTMDGNRIYVSRGIGYEHGLAPRIRLFCPPEVTLITIGGDPPGTAP